MSRSPQEIEREVEAARGDLDRTVEALKDKMSPGQLLDELTGSLKGSGGSELFANLGTQVRENPLALALVGAGLAWLMAGKGAGHASATAAQGVSANTGRHPSYGGLSNPDYVTAGLDEGAPPASEGGLKDKAAGAAQGVSDAVSQAAAKVGEGVAHAREAVLGAAGHAKHGVQGLASGTAERAGSLSGQAAGAGRQVQQGVLDLLDKEPLVVGALGFAVGAALGAALPPTAVEDRTFGAARDKVADQGRAMAQQGLHDVKRAAGAAYDGVRDEADRQGLTGSDDGGSLLDRAEQVARAGVEAARGEMGAERGH